MSAFENLISQGIVHRLGWTLLHFVWQGAALALVLAVALWLLRRRSAGARYLACCVALLLMAAMPLATFLVGQRAANFRSVLDEQGGVSRLPTGPYDGRPRPSPHRDSRTNNGRGRPFYGESPTEVKRQPAGAPTRHTPLLLQRDRLVVGLESVLPWLVAAWAASVLVLSLRLAGGWVHVQRLRRRAVEPVAEWLQHTAARLAQPLGVHRPARLLQSAAVQVPMVIGWLRPVILLPACALTGLAPQQIEALLAHELAHIRRYDYLVNLLQQVIETLLFYHPAVWWVSRRIRIEREHCSDDLAVAICGDRLMYARALAELEELRGRVPELAMASGGGPLLARIRRIVGLPTPDDCRTPAVLAGLVCLMLLISLGCGLALRAQGGSPSGQQPASGAASAANEKEDDRARVWLQRLWKELEQLEAKKRALAQRRWQALSVVEQATIVLQGWSQRGPSPQQLQAVQTEEGAHKFLADAQRQLGPPWQAHLAQEMMDALSNEERRAFEKARKSTIKRIAALGEPAVGALIDEIRAQGPHHVEASEALRQIGKPAVPAVLAALDRVEDRPLWMLLDVLAELKDPRTRPVFTRLLNDSNSSARLAALEGLKSLGAVSQDTYLRCLEDEYRFVRSAAVSGLAEVGDERAVPALLVVAQNDMTPDKARQLPLRESAFRAIERICQRTGTKVELPPRDTWRKGDGTSPEALRRAARCDNAGIRHDALGRLGYARTQAALDVLVEALDSDPVMGNRTQAIDSLGQLLRQTPEQGGLAVKRSEREAIFNKLLDIIESHLINTPAPRDQSSVRAPAPTGDSAAGRSLRSGELVRAALWQIGSIAGPDLPEFRRFPELLDRALLTVSTGDRDQQLACLNLLSRLALHHGDVLQNKLQGSERKKLIATLKRGMEDAEVSYRIRFIELLGYLREPSVVPRLIELLEHADPTVRSFSIHALGSIGDARVMPALERLAETDSARNFEGELYLRKRARRAIEQIRAMTQKESAR